MDFEKVYTEYFREIYLYLRGFGIGEDQAEELAQESFVKALRAADRFDGSQNIRAWLYSIARNTFFSWKRKQKYFAGDIRAEERSLEEDGAAVIVSSDRVAETVEEKELALAVHRILHEMEEPYKEVFHLRVFGELPFEKIGMIFGRSAGWARVTFYRARTQLQTLMEEGEYESDKL